MYEQKELIEYVNFNRDCLKIIRYLWRSRVKITFKTIWKNCYRGAIAK